MNVQEVIHSKFEQILQASIDLLDYSWIHDRYFNITFRHSLDFQFLIVTVISASKQELLISALHYF